MWIRLEKVDLARRQQRFYILHATQTLFGEWCLIREWGRIGTKGGQVKVDYLTSGAEALVALEDLKSKKVRRGYIPITAPRSAN